MAKILSIKDLHVDVASTPIINGLNLEIESGETHAIMGPNGSGKSTLAKTIAGHPDYKIKSGEIIYIDLKEKSKMVEIEQKFLSRGVNEGFSGGEKKRNEILQMLMLEPTLSILDETDSGLDIDSMKVVASGVNAFRNENTSSLIITHYERLLNYITPDYVHVFHNGVIIKTGDIQLAKDLEKRGYEWLTNP